MYKSAVSKELTIILQNTFLNVRSNLENIVITQTISMKTKYQTKVVLFSIAIYSILSVLNISLIRKLWKKSIPCIAFV